MSNEPPPPSSLIQRVRAMLVSAAALFWLIGLGCIYYGGNYLIEINLERQAEQYLPALANAIDAPVVLAQDSLQQRISDRAALIRDIGLVRIYDNNRTQLLAEYHKPGYQPLQKLDTVTVSGNTGHQLQISRIAGIAQSLRLLVTLPVSMQSGFDLLKPGAVTGYLEIGMDFAPSRSSAYPALLTIMGIFTAALFVFLSVYIRKMHQALWPLSSLQGPLQRIADGDFETGLGERAVDHEIEMIHRALRSIVVALQQREKKRCEAVETIAQIGHANRQHKETLINNLCHEIHTPMNGVIGMLDLLRDTELSRTQREFVRMAHASAEHLLRRLNNMLDFSHIETGKFSLENVAFNLLHEVSAATNVRMAAAKSKGIELIVHCSSARPHHLVGNPTRLRQIVTSLVSHAIRLSAQGQVVLNVRTEAQQDLCHLNITITSDGMNLTDRQLDEIFDEAALDQAPDYQQYSAQVLPLAMCKTLAELMGAQIGVKRQDSEVAAPPATAYSTSFCLSLKLPLAPNSALMPGDAGSAVRILFVTEDQPAYGAIEQQLKQQGYRADGFQNAAEALSALAAEAEKHDPYQIAILDYQLQGIDGEVLGGALKSDPNLGNTLLLMLCVESDADNNQRFARAGFAGCLEKSALPVVLNDTIEILCGSVKNGTTPPFITRETLYTLPLVPAEDEQSFAGYRVLIADDNIVNQHVALHILEKLGCHTAIANNGQEAIAMHASQAYDLILMDCLMPVLDGYQATAAIRAAEKGAHTPIIALTAFAMQGEREKCVAAGMDDFMAKPLRLSDMRDTLARWLRLATPSLLKQRDEFDSMQKTFGADFAELSALYLKDSPKRIAGLAAAVAEKNAAGIASAAHSLSGSCASIGATELAAICKDLEIQTKADQLDNIEEKMAAISAEYARVDTKLHAMMQSVEIK